MNIYEEQQKILNSLTELENQIKKKKQEVSIAIQSLNQPRKVEKAFLKSNKIIDKWKQKIRKTPLPIKKELQEPILELIKENGYSETIEGVKAGEFRISTPKGEKSIMLTPDKLIAWKYGDQYYKKWYCYENAMTPYPEDPVHNSEMFRKVTMKLAMNWRDRDDTKLIDAKTKMWIWIIGLIIIGIVLLISTDAGKSIVDRILSGSAPVVKEVIKENATKVAEAVKNVGVRVQ